MLNSYRVSNLWMHQHTHTHLTSPARHLLRTSTTIANRIFYLPLPGVHCSCAFQPNSRTSDRSLFFFLRLSLSLSCVRPAPGLSFKPTFSALSGPFIQLNPAFCLPFISPPFRLKLCFVPRRDCYSPNQTVHRMSTQSFRL